MSRTYTFDKNDIMAESGGRLTQGVFDCEILQAWAGKSQKGADSINFQIQTSAGQRGVVNIYTHDQNGEPLVGNGVIANLMAVLGVKSIAPKPGQYTRWSFEERRETMEEGNVYPALWGKKAGFVLQYDKTGKYLNVRNVYCPKRRLLANEIEAGTSGGGLEAIIARLAASSQNNATEKKATSPVSSTNEDFPLDDEIPF